jgi:GT2 family glycosyltransferase
MKYLPVISVAWNNREFIRPYFWHLRAMTSIPLKVYFWDNGSDDNTFTEAIEHKQENDVFVQSPVNIGLGLALNAASRLIHEDDKNAKFFAIVESDIFLGQIGVLDNALKALQQDTSKLAAFIKMRSMREEGHEHHGIGGAVVNMEHWRTCGGFPFGYHHWQEDIELFIRAKIMGHECICMQDGLSAHLNGGSVTNNLGDKREPLRQEDIKMYHARCDVYKKH